MTERELATVLAALRYWRIMNTPLQRAVNFPKDFAEHTPLDNAEIDALCERLNVAPSSTPARGQALTSGLEGGQRMSVQATYTATLYTQNRSTAETQEYDSLKAAKHGARRLFDAHGKMAGFVSITGPSLQITADQRNGTGMRWRDDLKG
jgi:hypothetical protein